MQLAIVFGLVLFVVFALALLLLLGRSSAQSALLEEVTRDVRGMGTTSPLWRSAVSSDSFAKPFTAFRRFFASEPDPEIVRRLLLAGYRKPHHADIFIGARLAVPAVLGLAVTLIFSQNTVFIFFLALVLGFFVPEFWLGHAINRRREQLRLSLPDGLDLLSICLEAGPVICHKGELRERKIVCCHADSDRPFRDAGRQVAGDVFRCATDPAPAKGGRNGRQDNHQTCASVGFLYFSCHRHCGRGTGVDRCGGFSSTFLEVTDLAVQSKRGELWTTLH